MKISGQCLVVREMPQEPEKEKKPRRVRFTHPKWRVRRALLAFRLPPLKGKLPGFFSVTVRANWRIIFRFEGSEALDLDNIAHKWFILCLE